MATKNDIPDRWYPKDIEQRARIDEYLEWQHNNTRFGCALYFQMKFLIPKLSGQPVDEEKLIFFKTYMEQVLGEFYLFFN
jgi:glutathione S-transferase